MTCKDLAAPQGTKTITPTTAAGWHAPLLTGIGFEQDDYLVAKVSVHESISPSAQTQDALIQISRKE